MNIAYRSLPLAAALLLIASPVAAQTSAASPFGNRASNAELAERASYQPPAVFATGAQFQVTGNQVQGTLDIQNADEETIGDIHYRIDLLSPAPAAVAENQLVQDAPDVYDSQVSSETFTLIPGEERRVPFTYTPPRVPQGEYRLRFQVVTSQGRELGWYDAPASLGVEGAAFVQITPGTFNLPEFPSEVIPPQSGPNVSPGSSFTLRATVKNISSQPVTATPVLELYIFDIARGRQEKKVLGQPLTLAANESREVEFPVTAAAAPEVYMGMVSLEDSTSTRLSNWAEYRWVVRGESAAIVSARLVALRQRQGEIVEVQVDYVGPADAETQTRGRLLVELTDTHGTVGSVSVPDVELTDAVQQGLARVTLTRDMAGDFGIKVTLFDQTDAVLDVYEVPVSLTETQRASLLALTAQPPAKASMPLGVWAGLAVAAVGVVGLLIWFGLRSRGTLPPSLPGTPLAALLIAVGLSVSGVSLAANGITVIQIGSVDQICQEQGGHGGWCDLGGGYITELFINSPIHQKTYPDRNAVPVSYRVSFVTCKNHWYYARNVIRYSPEGVTHSSWRPPAGTSWHNIVDIVFASNGQEECQTHFCKVSRHYNAALNFSRLPATAAATTLQIMSIRGGNLSGPPRPWVESEEHYRSVETFSIQPDHIDAKNLWVFFPTPTPDPNATPSPTPTLTPTPTSGATPTPSATPTISGSPVPTATPVFNPGGTKEIN